MRRILGKTYYLQINTSSRFKLIKKLTVYASECFDYSLKQFFELAVSWWFFGLGSRLSSTLSPESAITRLVTGQRIPRQALADDGA